MDVCAFNCLFLLATTLATDGDVVDPANVESLVNAHVAGLSCVSAVDLRLELHGVKTDGNGKKNEFPFGAWMWAAKGNLERIRYVQGAIPPEPGDSSTQYGDELRDETQVRALLNWDPSRVPKYEKPQDQSNDKVRVSGLITPLSQSVSSGTDSAVFLLRAISLPLVADERWTLRRLIAKSANAKVAGEAVIDGHPCIQLTIDHPGIRGGDPSGTYCEVFLDPSVNYAMRRIVEHVAIPQPDNGSTTVSPAAARFTKTMREVTKFAEVAKGCYFPKEASVHFYSEDGSSITGSIVGVTTELHVNDAVTNEALSFRFPENLTVTYMPPMANGFYKRAIWGSDDKPKFEFSDTVELDKYLQENFPGDDISKQPQKLPNNKWNTFALACNIGVAVGLLALYLAYKQRRNRR